MKIKEAAEHQNHHAVNFRHAEIFPGDEGASIGHFFVQPFPSLRNDRAFCGGEFWYLPHHVFE